nr:reverse transcriptase domain-containing protein [Tanacetum cinerariifolium]
LKTHWSSPFTITRVFPYGTIVLSQPDGPNFKKFKEDLFTYCIENGILQDSSEPSNDNTNVVNALQEPFVIKQDPDENSSQIPPPQINHHCCYGCGDSLEYIFCHQCTCELCGRGAHYGYNCPPKVPGVSNSEPCHNQNVDKLPQIVPSFDSTCYSEDGNSFTYDSTSNLVHESPNVFDPPLQPPIYSYEFCGNDAYYGHDCSLQVPFTYDPEPLYINTLSWDRPIVCYYDDDDEDTTITITPILSIEEPDNSLSMRDEHFDTILATESDEFIKSSVEDLVPILSESEDFSDSNDDSTSIDDDSFSIDNVKYVEASPPNSELVSLESSSTSLNSLLEETNTFDNSLPESETFYIDLEEIKISSGSTTTDSNSSLYDSFIFDLSINPFPPAGRRDFYEFADELAHIISLPEYDCFCFKNEPNLGDFTMIVVEDIFPPREPRVHNALPTHPTLQLNLDFILSSESLFAYIVWIFLPFLSYSVAP